MLTKIESNKTKLMFCLIFALIFIRYCYYGFTYYYQLDDYMQYFNYYNRGFTTVAKIAEIGLLSIRPLAGLADVLLWTRLFSVMIVGSAIISAMYAFSACLFQRVFKRHFGTGHIFLIVYTILPFGFEGTYWMGAATRIVVGLFFTAVALYFFEKWCSEGKVHNLIAYAVAQLISLGFYEQIIALSVAAILLLALLHFKANRRRAFWGLLSFLNVGIFLMFITYFSDSQIYGHRLSVILPTTGYYFKIFLPDLLNQIFTAFVKGGFYTSVKGFYRGVLIFISQPNILYLIGILALCTLLFFSVRKAEREVKNTRIGVLIGLALILAPLAPYFIAEQAWFSFRGMVSSLCGIALIVDTVFARMVKNTGSRRTVTAAVAAVFALYCCIASISEIHDYKKTTENDARVVAVIGDRLEEDGYKGADVNVGILNLDPSFLEDQNYFYHEHIHGVTESDWALTDAVEQYWRGDRPKISPLRSETMYEPWCHETRRLSNFDAIYLYSHVEGTLTRVYIEEVGEEAYDLYDGDGGYLGYTWEEDFYGYIELS